jgi:hypothetical protein
MNRSSPKDVRDFKEMVTYLTILAKGRGEGEIAVARRFIYRLAPRRFGEPDEASVAELDEIQDVERLESLGEKLVDFEIKSWDDLWRGE